MKRALPLLLLLCGCDMLGTQWKGWVYPDRNNLRAHISLGAFPTLEECRRSARTTLANFNLTDEEGEPIKGDYECGYKCKAGSPGDLTVCEKTEH